MDQSLSNLSVTNLTKFRYGYIRNSQNRTSAGTFGDCLNNKTWWVFHKTNEPTTLAYLANCSLRAVSWAGSSEGPEGAVLIPPEWSTLILCLRLYQHNGRLVKLALVPGQLVSTQVWQGTFREESYVPSCFL